MDKLEAFRMFVRVVESGSFSQAGRELNVSQPTVSKQVAALEARLGAQLLWRNPRSLTTTAAGQDLYDAAVRILEDVEAAEEKVSEGQSAPSGLVRVTLPPAFGRLHVIPRLREYYTRFPDVSIEMEISGRHVDLVEEGFDVAIRIGRLLDSALFARRIGEMRMITVASARYFAARGIPPHPDQLVDHDRIGYVYQGRVADWGFDDNGQNITISGAGPFRTNDAEHVRQAVLADLGIAHHASWLFADVVATGEVVRVLEDFAPQPFPIQAVTVAGRRMPARVRSFVDFLADICNTVQDLRTGL